MAALDALVGVFTSLLGFYGSLMHYWLRRGSYASCPFFKNDLHARTFMYSMSLLLPLWSKPHYRNPTFHDDLVKNLRNIAIPGTCIPLSWVACSRLVLIPFLLFVYPWLCVVGAAYEVFFTTNNLHFLTHFVQLLVRPQHWFSFWRLNCHLVSLHSLKTNYEKEYLMENKWDFLLEGEAKKVPISPFLKTPQALVIKDRNEEGGMGIFVFENAVHGGKWIVQEKLENAEWVQQLLPPNAPLSTFRIITASRYGLGNKEEHKAIQSLSCVFRAGLEKAPTDHESIMFDVDMQTGTIRNGSTTTHWYKVGAQHFLQTPWSVGNDIVAHPDTGKRLVDEKIPNLSEMRALVEDAHLKMMKHVPLAGWDIAVTSKGIFLLEVNLSCNFFRGTFDQKAYFAFLDEYFSFLDPLPLPLASQKKFH